MDLSATVHLDSQVDFLPAITGLTVRFITVINRGKELTNIPPTISILSFCSKSVINQSSD